ncbi:MAG: F0F1 ATP synthase subunit B [Sphingomonas sp.]|nr:F0F1 ATP synthase subunit B [Sphingomonas sp.]
MVEAVTQSVVEHPLGEGYEEASAFGLEAPAFIALAMLVVIVFMLWKKVPSAIGKALDEKIATIRDQLAEAEGLRKDAEALKAEYEAKAKSVDKERKTMLERARKEADEIVAKAAVDAEALIERRGRMAEDKIAAKERSAINQLRNAAANAATNAAAKLIAERNDPAIDARLIDQAIGDIGR